MAKPYGSINLRKLEASRWAKEFLDDPEYKANLWKRLREGTLPPQIEALLWYYAWGKPREYVISEVTVQSALTDLTREELAARAERIARALRSGGDAILTDGTDDDETGELRTWAVRVAAPMQPRASGAGAEQPARSWASRVSAGSRVLSVPAPARPPKNYSVHGART